jgi:hypothetical protein
MPSGGDPVLGFGGGDLLVAALNDSVVCNAEYLDWGAFGYALARHVALDQVEAPKEPTSGCPDAGPAGVSASLRRPRPETARRTGRASDSMRLGLDANAVVGAVRVAWRYSDSGPGLEERADDADAVGHDVLVTRHGAARPVRGRDLRAERGGVRVSPRDPLKLCGVHGCSTSWVS